MIDIFYDNNIAHLTNRPYVAAAGTGMLSAKCFLGHQCDIIRNVNEPNYNGSNDFVTADGTHIHSGDEWLNYLKKYCPAP